MDELISKTALLTHFRKERDDYFRAHFKQDPATGTWEAPNPEEEYLSDLEERIDFIEQFPGVEPVATLINNNQPGWTNIIETDPNVTIDVGTKLYAPTTEGYNRLRDALVWFSSHEVEKKLGHLPEWVVGGRTLTGGC